MEPAITIRDMRDEEFVGSCTHIDETAEWTASCLTTDTEAERVHEVVGEFDNPVLLREYCSDDRCR